MRVKIEALSVEIFPIFTLHSPISNPKAPPKPKES